MSNEFVITQHSTLLEILQHAGYKRVVLSFIILVVCSCILTSYPLHPVGLAVILIFYGYYLLRYPDIWLLCLPAVLPIMDFTPWTGRFFFDEFDLVVLTTIALRLLHPPQKQHLSLFSRWIFILLVVFCTLYAISLLMGLLPLQVIDANAFSNPYSYYNGLRIGKGVIWAFLLLPSLKQALQQNNHAIYQLTYGILIGLTGVILISIIERSLFVGLFDFSSDYRISGLFSSMNTGSGDIETYLMLSLPCVGVLFFGETTTLHRKIYGVSLLIAGFYVLVVTFSRGAYIGFAIGFIVYITGLVFRMQSVTGHTGKLLAGSVIVIIIVLGVFQGSLIQQRFSTFSEDKATRTHHWSDAIGMIDTPVNYLVGMGLGSYPRTYFWANTEHSVPATYKIDNDGINQYLKLRGGDALFMGQYINVKPQTQYRLQFDARTSTDKSILTIAICEKSLLYSIRCNDVMVPINFATNNLWQPFDYIINMGEVGLKSNTIAAGLMARPVQLSVYNNAGAGKIIDVDNIRLINTDNENKLVNGDFSQGTDYWFFATEKPWHVLNLWVQILFDQGVLGLMSFVLLLLSCFYTLCKKQVTDPFATVFLSGLSAFVVVGWVESPLDAPRITLLFFLILFCALANVAYIPTILLKHVHTE